MLIFSSVDGSRLEEPCRPPHLPSGGNYILRTARAAAAPTRRALPEDFDRVAGDAEPVTGRHLRGRPGSVVEPRLHYVGHAAADPAHPVVMRRHVGVPSSPRAEPRP